jgi:hypothetical protein
MNEEAEKVRYSIRYGLARYVAKFAKKLAKDFGIPPPRFVDVVKPEDIEEICGIKAYGCYKHPSEIIVISEIAATKDVSTLLHEFVHHLQYIRAGRNDEKAFPKEDHSKPHCERKHEREAKDFEKFYEKMYADLYSEGLQNILSLYRLCHKTCADVILDNKPILEKLIEGVDEEELINTVKKLSEKGLIPDFSKYEFSYCLLSMFKKFPCQDVLEIKEYLREIKRILEELDWWREQD